jgi:hypothetical protein
MVHGIILAAMLSLIADNGSADQIPPPPQPPSRPAQVSMDAADWTLKQSPDLARIWGDWGLKHGGEVYQAVPWDRSKPGLSYWLINHAWTYVLLDGRKADAHWLLNHRPTSLGTHLSHPSPDPQEGWSLSLGSLFPGPSKSFSYLVTTASPILTQGQYVKMVGVISASGAIPNKLPAHALPASCRMYFREVDDDPFYRKTHHLHYRWWSIAALLLQGGRFVFVVGLEPQFWQNTGEEPGDYSAAATAGFQRALANPQTIGIMCQGGFVAGNRDVPFGSALFHPTFSMFSFAVCDPSRGGPTSDFADAPSAKQQNEACSPPSAQQR